jgi:hypothetical protein
MKRANKVAALLLILTFSVGALAGMAIEEATGIDWFEFLDEDRDDDTDDVRLLSGLQLSAAQRETIDDIVDRQEDDLEAYWKGRMPEIEAIMAKSYAEIRTHLNADQQAVFDGTVRKLKGSVPEEFQD